MAPHTFHPRRTFADTAHACSDGRSVPEGTPPASPTQHESSRSGSASVELATIMESDGEEGEEADSGPKPVEEECHVGDESRGHMKWQACADYRGLQHQRPVLVNNSEGESSVPPKRDGNLDPHERSRTFATHVGYIPRYWCCKNPNCVKHRESVDDYHTDPMLHCLGGGRR